ncbi:MAG: hypothetical protein WCC18_14635 [Candidatus Acidiferrales bacterium]
MAHWMHDGYGYWPAEKRVKNHYKKLGYTVSDAQRSLDFMIYRGHERFAVEVKTFSGDFLKLKQLQEMKRLRDQEDIESFVALVSSGCVGPKRCLIAQRRGSEGICNCTPIEIVNIRDLVDEVYKALETNFERARKLGHLLQISAEDLVSGRRVPNEFTRLAGSRYFENAPTIVCPEGLLLKPEIERRAEGNKRGQETRRRRKANKPGISRIDPPTNEYKAS